MGTIKKSTSFRVSDNFTKELKQLQCDFKKKGIIKTQAEIFDEMIDIYNRALKKEYDVYVTEAMEGFLMNRNIMFYRKMAEVINGVLEHVDERNDYVIDCINEMLNAMDK